MKQTGKVPDNIVNEIKTLALDEDMLSKMFLSNAGV